MTGVAGLLAPLEILRGRPRPPRMAHAPAPLPPPPNVASRRVRLATGVLGPWYVEGVLL